MSSDTPPDTTTGSSMNTNMDQAEPESSQSAQSASSPSASVHADGVAPGEGSPGQGGESKGKEGVNPAVEDPRDWISEPAKIMRIGAMARQLLEEVRQLNLDEQGRARMAEIYTTSISELASGVSDDLRQELARLALPFSGEVPTEGELRVAQAQLVGWLEGLFHGVQATLMAQQMAAQGQLEELRRRGLPSGDAQKSQPRMGNYL
jgi:hypothetical protein